MIVDTNALSAWADGDAGVLSVLPSKEQIAIPVIVLGEYLGGLRRSNLREVLEPWLLNQVIPSIEILPVTFSTAEVYADLDVALRTKGRPIPQNDMWIACLALEHGLPIISDDHHFDHVDGLTRINWR